MLFWIDGEFVDEEQATMPVVDYGHLYGDGLFDSIAVLEGKVIDLDRHVERLFRGARALRIEMPHSIQETTEIFLETAARNGMHETDIGYLRPHVTRGAGTIGINEAARRAGQKGVLRVLAARLENSHYRGPIPTVEVVLSSYERGTARGVDPRIKCVGYTSVILATIEAQERGADTAIMHDSRGFLTEAAGSNLILVRGGRIHVPSRAGVLDGITVRRMLEVAAELGYEVVEEDLTRWDLETADEAFLVATNACILAIRRFEGLDIPAPGPITAELRDAYVESALAAAVPIAGSAVKS
jgi:branched-chain amino acid aminotransferase